MEKVGRKCRKTKLIPREINESDEEIFALQSVVESTLAKIKRPCKKTLSPMTTPSILPNANSILEMDTGQKNIVPMNFDIKIEVETVEDGIEKPQEILSWRKIVKESTEIYLKSNNICDKILHAQVLNTCKPDLKVFVKTAHEKLLDRALTRWCDWASLTEEPKDPPLFYKCYICDTAWWHLVHFRDHIRTHDPANLRVVLEMNDYVECNIVAYVNKTPNKYIANIEGKCWKCGETAYEHTKLKTCSGCKKRFYTCGKLRQHQWYCEGFKKMHLELFAAVEKIFKCHLCRFYFFKREDSIDHMISRHSVRSDVPIPCCTVCETCGGLVSYENDHVCESKGYLRTCTACKRRVTKSSDAVHRIEGNTTCSVCQEKVRNCAAHLHAINHTSNYGLAYKCLTCNFFIIFDMGQIKKHKMAYHSNRDFDYDLIAVPKTIVDRLKMPSSIQISPVDTQIPINPDTIPQSQNDHEVNSGKKKEIDVHENKNEIEEDDDVIIIDNVPEVVVIPSDDAPSDDVTDDLPCVIANIKSEPLENKIQSSNKGTDAKQSQNKADFETILIQVPKDFKGVFQSLANRINDNSLDDIKNEPDYKLNDFMQSALGVLSTQNETTTSPITNEKANAQHRIRIVTNPLVNIKKSMDTTYKEMEDMKKSKSIDVDIEKMLPTLVKTMTSQNQNVQKSMQVRQYGPKVTGVLKPEAEIKMEVIRSTSVTQNCKRLSAVDLCDDTQPKTPKLEPDTSEKEINDESENQRTVEIEVDPVQIKEEVDPEMDLKLSDIKKIYHINVNVSENEVDVKREINEFDLSGQIQNWNIERYYKQQNSSDDEFEDLISITPNGHLNIDDVTDDETKQRHRKQRKQYSCTRCNFRGMHKEFKHHRLYECRKSVCLYNCSACKKQFKSMHKYLLHFDKHKLSKFMCPQCGFKGVSVASLSTHVKMHINSLFVSYRSLNCSDVVNAPGYKCKLCEMDVAKIEFIKHWDTHLDLQSLKRSKVSTTETFNLPHGFQALDTIDNPDIKKALELFTDPEKLTEKMNFRKCILCSRQFNRRNDTKRHLIEHFLKNAYSVRTRCNGLRCQICGQVFDKIDTFRGHMRLHACLPVYKCEICDKTFSDSSNFCKHKKVHNLQILICDICKKKFNNKAHLARHIKEHETTPAIACEKCKRVFFNRSAMKKHYRAYHVRCPRFKCHECNMIFTSLKDKWDHMWNIHKQREFEADCTLCDAKFRKKSDLKRHYAKIHDCFTSHSEDVFIKTEPTDA